MANNRKLGKRTDQRVALVYGQATQLLWYGKIETTVDRAKEVRKVAEKMITLAVKTYQDVVTVTKSQLNQKNEKIDVEYTNDGPKKLAARRKLIASLYDLPEVRAEKESKQSFRDRTKEIGNPLVEKLFRDLAPKYDKRAQELGIGGGYTRILKTGNRVGDNADTCIIELV